MTGVLIKMGNLVTETDMYTGRMIWRHREKKTAMWPERCIYKPRNTKDWQWTAESINRRGKEGFFLRISRESVVLPTVWFWNSSLHNCDTVSFYCFLSPSLWYFVNSIPGNLFPWPLRLHFCFRNSDAGFRTNSNLLTLSGLKCCSFLLTLIFLKLKS